MTTPVPRTILFAMLGETGHYAGTFRLARGLRARGHRIVYLGLADFEPLVAAEGFEFSAFAADLLPAGYLRSFAAAQASAPRGLYARWRNRRAGEPLFAEYLRRIDDGRLDDALRACAPDLLLCDSFVWYVGLRAHALGIATLSLSTCLSLHRDARIPPSVIAMPAAASWWSSLRVRLAWRRMRAKFFFTKRVASRWLGAFRSPTRMHHLHDEFLRIAAGAGYPCREDDTYWFGEYGPRLALPEIVLCPRAFQLPGAPDDRRRYAGDFVDAERREEPLPPGALDDEKPLVLCSLGTSPGFYPHAPRFFAAVIEAARARPDWQVVLHAGNRCREIDTARVPPNLLLREQVPQLALLRRAAVMVTHGGMNSIMECVHFGVPMVIVPGLRDQPGNSTRAVHHGLAVRARMARITGPALAALVARAMDDAGIRRGLAAMKRAIADERGVEQAVAFIEATCSGSGSGVDRGRTAGAPPGRSVRR